jgi:hypothetical protein
MHVDVGGDRLAIGIGSGFLADGRSALFSKRSCRWPAFALRLLIGGDRSFFRFVLIRLWLFGFLVAFQLTLGHFAPLGLSLRDDRLHSTVGFDVAPPSRIWQASK